MKIPELKFEYFSKTIKYKGFNIQTYVIGGGDQAVLSFPSFPHSGLYYLWFLNHYDLSRVKFYTLDLPGWIGYSDNVFTNKPFSLDEYMQIIKVLIQTYNLKSFSVLGYSFGGALSVKLVNDRPDLVKKVVLISPVLNSTIIQNTKEVLVINLAKKLGLDQIFDFYLKRIWGQYKPIILSEGFPKGLLAIYDNMLQRASSKIILDSIYAIFHTDLTYCLNSLEDKQLLIVNSRSESKMFRKQAELLRRRFSDGKSIFFSGSHEDFILKPNAEVVRKVVHFLTT